MDNSFGIDRNGLVTKGLEPNWENCTPSTSMVELITNLRERAGVGLSPEQLADIKLEARLKKIEVHRQGVSLIVGQQSVTACEHLHRDQQLVAASLQLPDQEVRPPASLQIE